MFKKVISNLLTRKSAQELLDRARKGSLKKALNAFDLFVIGIGAVVGTGILTIIGTAIQGGPESIGAGPAIIISMALAALACVFSALCYSEVASIIPVSGSVYTYCYATLGEFAAWIVGWVLMLNYVIGNITVASSWCGYLTQLLKGFSQYLPSFITNCPIWLRSDVRSIYHMCEKYGLDVHDKIPFLFDKIPFAINLPVIALTLISTLILVKGIKESTRFASIMVGLNLFMIISFVIVGAFYVKPENWVPFAPNGISGILMGAFIIFFAYIGFDAVSTAAEETKNPQKDLPVAILGTLIFCTILYVLVALVLTGIVPVNLAVSGTGYRNDADDSKAFYQVISDVPTDADVVTIFGGFNDGLTDLGDADDTGTTTVGGCINTTLDNLYTAMPVVQLGIIAPTPWVGANPYNHPEADAYVELLEAICKKRSIPFLNLYYESNLRPWDSTFRTLAYSKDDGNGVHPDETGHKIIASRIEGFLDSLLLS